MANRNIFEFLLSSEIEQINVDTGVSMIYHSNWISKLYKAGSVVRYDNGVAIDIYINVYETSGEPGVDSSWELLVNGLVLPRGSMITSLGLQMVDSSGDILKVY